MHSLVTFARRVAFAAIVAVAAAAPVTIALSVLAPQAAEAAVAASISVTGNQRIEAATIKSYLTIKPGKSYTAEDVDDSVKALYGTSLFADVSIVQHGSVLVVTVAENPVINSIVFEGNKKIKSAVLVTIITLKTRGVLTDAKLQTDISRIKDYYATNGRSQAYVTAKITDLGENRVDVRFLIDEGDKTGVARITFVGNDSFSSSRLSHVILTRRTNWLSWLNRNDIYSEDKLRADEDALRTFYLSHGYADFQVLDAHADFDETKGKYYLTFTLDEGAKYTYGDISVDSSIPGVDSSTLNKFLSTRSGKTFDSTEVQKTVEELTVELSRLGYVFAVVAPRGDRDYTNHIIAITYVIDEGPRAYIQRIDIRGNTKTRDYVIRRAFTIAEGDAYNRVLIDKAQRTLQALGYFKTVNITTHQGSSPDKVVVNVDVEEKSTGSFSVAAGVSSTQGVVAELSLEETNFLGRGQHLRISFGGGKSDRTFNIAFTDPYFLGYHMSAGFNIYRNTSKSTSLRPLGTTSTGGGITVGLPLNDALSLSLNYRLAQEQRSGIAPCDPVNGIGPDTGTVTGCYFASTPAGNSKRLTSAAGYALQYSTIDDYLNPHDGVFLKFSQDFAGIGGNARYIRSVAQARYYHTIGAKTDIVGLVNVSGGNITGLGMPVAVVDNFYKGGETVRGFAPFGYGPRDTTTGSPAGSAGVGMALGGKNYWSATAEVQFPLPVVPPDLGLRGAVFADAGMLWGVDSSCTSNSAPSFTCANDTKLRSSVGGSILWASPIGNLRFDCAAVLSKASYDKTQVCRIGAGATF
jgi:outer membrane protein insertion porin family